MTDMDEKRGLSPVFSLAGQNALVIGGTSGIGKASAAGFAQSGARVIVAGRDAGKLERALGELKSLGDAHGERADASDDVELRALVARTIAAHGRIDILVNSQGMTTLKPAEEFTAADWDEVIGTDLRSVFFACTEVGRHMLARGSGNIINIASLASYRGWPRSALYGISKAGVGNLTEAPPAGWRGPGVRVEANAPGVGMTDLNPRKIAAGRQAPAL